MKNAERIIDFLWIGLAFGVCFTSVRLGVGSPSDPGPGFLPMGTGAMMGILAAAHLLTSLRKPDSQGPEPLWANVRWGKVACVIAALLIYALLLEKVGYLIDTFLLMIFLFSILERKRWWVVLSGSLVVIGITHLVFNKWLMVQFPTGLF